MSIPSWANTYPRLCELYLESERGHPNSYFEHKTVSANLLRQPHDPYYVELEQVLNLMDSDAWREFKKKTKPYVTAKEHWPWHAQLFERFHEARGYALLVGQGYSEVHFIPEEKDRKTPDFKGTGNQGLVLLEAKRIRDSDKENREIVSSMKQKNMKMHERVHSLPDGLKGKINCTVQQAKTQLKNYDTGDNVRRILFLSIRIDLWCDSNEIKQQIRQYLSQLETDIEIVCQIENDFSYD